MTIYELAYELQTLMDDYPEMASVPVSVFLPGYEDTSSIELSVPAEFQINRLRVGAGSASLIVDRE